MTARIPFTIACVIALAACGGRSSLVPQVSVSAASMESHVEAPSAGSVPTPHFTVYPVPYKKIGANYFYDTLFVTADAQDNAWFACNCGGLIGRMTPDGVFTGFSPWATKPFSNLPNIGYQVLTPVLGPGGKIWFGFRCAGSLNCQNDRYPSVIGSVDENGTFSGFVVPQKGWLDGMAADATSVWTDNGNGLTYSLTPDGTFKAHPISYGSAKNPMLTVMAVDPQHHVWMNWLANNGGGPSYMVRFNGPTQTSYRTFGTDGTIPWTKNFAPDGSLWYTDQDKICGTSYTSPLSSGVVERFDPETGSVKTFCLPHGFAAGHYGAFGSDGAYWFLNSKGVEYLGRITMDGTITEYRLPKNAGAFAMTAGTNNDLWISGGNTMTRVRI